MIENLLKERILILDGAMGTAIQNFLLEENDFRGQEFENHAFNLKGNNDVLNLTKPEIIAEIHKKYIDAGADIIETNTFNSNALSQQEYGLADLVYRLNFEGAKIAKQQAQNADKQVFVAGSIGPTSKLLSLSPDINRPEFRATDFDFLATTYAEQVSGLIDGGVDILLIETAFDALNVKAALYAVSQVFDNKQVKLPVMVSATVNDRYGHTLTGQSLEAFYNSISHFPLLSFGLNCSFGAEMLMPLIERLHKVIPCYLSIYPNAGLPNEMGHYDETPCFTASVIEKMAQRGLLNIVGGCCGTTPEHISEIKKHLQNIPPRSILHCHCGLDPQSLENKAIPAFAGMTKSLIVSGLENVVIDKKISNFVNIGERTNVAGSAKFARLIREKNYEEAAQIAKNQIENGASIIDINFDDAMLNSAEEMEKFVRYISNDADIAKAALMIDSSDWQTIVAGLKNFQGKSIVNSISLKEGKEVFLQKAREIQRLGAAIIVMAFDEKGQAASFERKIEICRRAYDLLTQKLDFQPYNIIFDVNVLTIGTGIDEHNNYAVDFIEAVRWIKNNLKGALTSGGISNLSFAFRGNNAIREAMHSVFLYHAINAGLDMGIVNPAMLQIYDDIEPNLLQKVENVVLNKTKNATEELLEYASSCHSREGGNPPQNKTFQPTGDSRLRGNDTILAVENRLANALRYGNSEFLADDLREALQKYSSAVEIIEKPLMAAMDKVGELFGEGKMFLPQVIKSAKVMKTAIEILQPEIETQKSAEFSQKRPKIVIATAKGDIHDIGKNILCIMLACNNFEVIDLGIMVENQAVIEAIKLHKPDFVGVSALITPSLSEMADLCQMLENEQFKLPFFVGGAAASAIHTAVKLSPLYSFGVFYGGNASSSATLMKKYLQNPQEIILQNSENQKISIEKYQNRKENILTFAQSQNNKPVFSKESFLLNKNFGKENLLAKNLNINILENYINWKEFLHFWQVSRAQENENYAQSLINEAKEILKTEQENFEVSYIVKFFDAYSVDNQIVLLCHSREGGNPLISSQLGDSRLRGNDTCVSLPMLRSQVANGENLCLADYFPDKALNISAKIGLFCVTANHNNLPTDEKSFEYLVRKTLCARLAEAASQYIQTLARTCSPCLTNGTDYKSAPASASEALHATPLRLIASAFGYAVCPDHSLKRDVFDLLDAENQIGVQLSETYGISPSTSICGMLIAHPNAKYFNILNIDNEQFTHYCKQRNFSEEKMKKLLGHLL